jgi:co-chaperonin GroES (HSP10)
VLRPLNKHLVVKPVEEVKTETGVLVPQGARVDKNPYKLVEIIEVHENSLLKNGYCVVVPSHMVEEVSFYGKTHYLVLENHVVGYYEKPE